MRRFAILILVWCMGGAVAGFAANAKENWVKHCQKCHGEDGKGKTTMGKKLKVRDYTDPKVQEKFKDEELIKITKEGKKEGSKVLMKPYADILSEQEIKDLVAFIRKFKK